MQFKNNPKITKKVTELDKFIGGGSQINEVLECIKIDALQDSLMLTATNGNGNFYKSVIPDVEVMDEGTILMPASALSDMLTRMPDGLVKTSAKGVMSISTKGAKLAKGGIISDFAAVPPIKPTGNCVIAFEQLKRAFQQVAHSTKKNSANLMSSGVHILSVDGDLVIETCCDTSASRYVIKNVPIQGTIDALVPADTISSKIASNKTYDSETAVTIHSSEKYTVFTIDNDKILSVNIASKFMDIDRILRAEYEAEITANTAALKDMVKDAICIAANTTKTRAVLRLTIKNKGTVIDYEIDSGTSNASGKFPCDCNVDNFEDVTIGVNPLFIKEILTFFGDEVLFKVKNATSPLLFTNIISDIESSMFLVLPIRLR